MQGGSRFSLEELPSITEEDGESSVRSGKSKSSTSNNNDEGNNKNTAAQPAAAEPEIKKEKKKKKKSKTKEPGGAGDYSAEDHDTAQQILVDLCTEMKDLKNSMEGSQIKTNETLSSNLDSNSKVMASLSSQMEMLQSNMSALDQTIESKATPDQIEELARIRAVQEMMKVVTDDKERTVGVYEAHARRGYEEIERLRQDLASERKEVGSLRAELTMVRGDRQRTMAMAHNHNIINNNNNNGPPPPAQFVGGDGASSLGGDSRDSAGNRRSDSSPGGMFLNGNGNAAAGFRNGDPKMGGGDFDDMTLETKGSYDTLAYETKSLKKRIIHMKKKLTVAQLEAKETDALRAEVERLRVQCDTERKGSQAKEETIRRLEREIELLKRSKADAVAKSSQSGGSRVYNSGSSSSSQGRTSGSSKTVVNSLSPKKSKDKNKWWQNL